MGLPPNLFFGNQQSGGDLESALMQGNPQQSQPQQQPQEQPQQQSPANNAANAGPVKAGLRAVLGGMLHRMSYQASQALIQAGGGETDAEKASRLATMAHVNAQTALTNAQTQQMQNTIPFQMPNGAILHLPAKMATDLAKQQLANQGKKDVADVNQQGKRFMAIPNVGLVDTQHPSGTPTLVAGTNPKSVTVTPEIAQQYNIPQQLIGQAIPLQNFVGLERGGAAWAGNVSNTTETKELADGSLVQIPKTTSSQKVAPKAPGNVPAPAVSPNTRGGVKTLVGNDGLPLHGKTAADTVYATDPKTGTTIFTDRSTAAVSGMTNLQKVTPVQRRKDEALSNRLADVQRKVGDYAETFSQPIDSQDKQAIAYLMDHNIGAGISVHGISTNILPQYVQDQLKARGMQALSEAGMRRYIQFNQARESLSGYQQILTNSSKSSDSVLQLQLEQLPPPLADSDFANMSTGEFQKNLDLAGQHMPIFPGSNENQQSIKAQQAQKHLQNQQIQTNQSQGMEQQQHQGHTYQRKKGSNDPWKLVKPIANQ